MPLAEKLQFHYFSGPIESVDKEGKKGFFVSTLAALLIVIVAVFVVIVVGLLVHFLSPSAPRPYAEHQWQTCVKLAAQKNESE